MIVAQLQQVRNAPQERNLYIDRPRVVSLCTIKHQLLTSGKFDVAIVCHPVKIHIDSIAVAN